MLEVADLAISYGGTQALRGITLAVRGGEAVALLGPNGAGKTTTLRAISGLVQGRGGITFDGEDLRGVPPEHVARRGLIHVPEGHHVFPTLTVIENLEFGRIAARGRAGAYSVADIFDLFPALVPLRKRDGFALSGGEQQMVAVGRALVAAPRLLLLDEPSLGLAPTVAHAVFDALRQVKDQTPMLVVEQNTELALGLCARAYVLSAGSMVLEGTADEVGDRSTLMASYLGQRDVLGADA